MNLEKTLEALRNSHVEFVLIGGAAMAVQGSAYVTRDLDFCYARTGKNMEQLAAALSPFHVKLRGAPGNLPFRFDAETIALGLNFTLITDLGEIDLLGEVVGLGDFEKVRAESEKLEIYGTECLVLSLSGLIKSKRAAGRPRDLMVLPELEALKELRERMAKKE